MNAVYGIINSANGKMYIGSTTNYKGRKNDHFKTLRKGKSGSKKLQEDFDYYGEDKFSIAPLEILDGVEDNFLKKEDEYVLKYNTLVPNGYNECLPSSKNDSPIKKSEGSKRYYLNNAPHNLKKITAEEWLEAKKENPNFSTAYQVKGIEQKKEIYRIDENSYEVLETYPSLASVTDSDSFRVSINRNRDKPYKFSKYKGQVYIRKEDYNFPLLSEKPLKEKKVRNWKKNPEDIIPMEDRNFKRNPISLQNIITKEIKNFKSYSEAALFLGSKQGKISELIKGFRNKGGGRISKVTNIKGWAISV